MTISKWLMKHLRCEVDFGEFYLLDVVVKRHKPTIVLLAPKNPDKEHAYWGIRGEGRSQWYCSMDHMLETCVDSGYMSKQRARYLTRRYQAMRARDAA